MIQPISANSSCYLHVDIEMAFHPLKQSPFTFTGTAVAFYCLFIFNGSILRFPLSKEWYNSPEAVTVRLVLVSVPPSWHLAMLHLHFPSWATTVLRSWTCLKAKALWPGNCIMLADSAFPVYLMLVLQRHVMGWVEKIDYYGFLPRAFFLLFQGISQSHVKSHKDLMCWLFSSTKPL